jgi:hypothetical protein
MAAASPTPLPDGPSATNEINTTKDGVAYHRQPHPLCLTYSLTTAIY